MLYALVLVVEKHPVTAYNLSNSRSRLHNKSALYVICQKVPAIPHNNFKIP